MPREPDSVIVRTETEDPGDLAYWDHKDHENRDVLLAGLRGQGEGGSSLPVEVAVAHSSPEEGPVIAELAEIRDVARDPIYHDDTGEVDANLAKQIHEPRELRLVSDQPLGVLEAETAVELRSDPSLELIFTHPLFVGAKNCGEGEPHHAGWGGVVFDRPDGGALLERLNLLEGRTSEGGNLDRELTRQMEGELILQDHEVAGEESIDPLITTELVPNCFDSIQKRVLRHSSSFRLLVGILFLCLLDKGPRNAAATTTPMQS